MSKYESENGTIKFAKSNYPKILKFVRDIHNNQNTRLFTIATTLYNKLKALRGIEKQKEELNKHTYINHNHLNPIRRAPTALIRDEMDVVRNELFRCDPSGKTKLYKPRRSAFVDITNKERDISIEIDDLTVSLDSKRHSLTWDVEQGNRSTDQARESYLGKALFTFLNKTYKWGRSEGGSLYYTSHENDDDCGHGDISDGASERFGLIGKREEDANRNAQQAYHRALYR